MIMQQVHVTTHLFMHFLWLILSPTNGSSVLSHIDTFVKTEPILNFVVHQNESALLVSLNLKSFVSFLKYFC